MDCKIIKYIFIIILIAFRADAIDYLEKPISIDDLKKAILKVSKYHSNNTINNSGLDYGNLSESIQLGRQLDKLSIPTKNGYVIIVVNHYSTRLKIDIPDKLLFFT